MNILQNTIFKIIVKISNTPGAFDYGDSVLYGLKNYIARHSLANDEYFVSEQAFSLFGHHNLSVPLRRSKIGGLKQYFTFEHPIPASVVMKAIKSSGRTSEEIDTFLKVADCVTLVTKEEDRKVATEYKSSMPEGWNHQVDSQFVRYELCGIPIRKEKIAVFGTLIR